MEADPEDAVEPEEDEWADEEDSHGGGPGAQEGVALALAGSADEFRGGDGIAELIDDQLGRALGGERIVHVVDQLAGDIGLFAGPEAGAFDDGAHEVGAGAREFGGVDEMLDFAGLAQHKPREPGEGRAAFGPVPGIGEAHAGLAFVGSSTPRAVSAPARRFHCSVSAWSFFLPLPVSW